MTATVSLLVPTRDRPERCADMWRSALSTAAEPKNLELVLYLDDDEPRMRDYLTWMETEDPTQTWMARGPRILLSETWNRCADIAVGEIMWHGNDDVLFRTEAWDESVRGAFNEFPDRIACVHGRDGIHDGGSATLGFYSREWVEALGYFVPPYFASDYNDTWLTEVANELGRRRFLPEVYTEHMHPVAGKGTWDRTHQERMTRHAQENVDALYASLAHERRADAAKLRRAIEESA